MIISAKTLMINILIDNIFLAPPRRFCILRRSLPGPGRKRVSYSCLARVHQVCWGKPERLYQGNRIFYILSVQEVVTHAWANPNGYTKVTAYILYTVFGLNPNGHTKVTSYFIFCLSKK